MSSNVTPQRSAALNLDLPLFAGTIFLSAGLLFAVQPMFAKFVLPKLGGAPAVWSVATVFFQSALLAGYAFANFLVRIETRRALVIHLSVMTLAALLLPISVATGFGQPPAEFTALWLFALFAVSVGLPFFAVSTNGPLLQAWFGRTGHRHAADPYFLYAASNIGSFIALLGYPILFEPLIGASAQSAVWSAGFLMLMALVAACGLKAARGAHVSVQTATADASTETAFPTTDWRRRATWVGLAFIPSALLVGVTAHISTDVAAVPFLWVLPLCLFLLTFVITFQRRPVLNYERLLPMHLYLASATIILLNVVTSPWPIVIVLPLHLTTFFIAAMVCHGELVRNRPRSSELTTFYLWMSFGGVLGGVFAGLLAPVMFRTVVEYPLVLFASLAVHPTIWRTSPSEWGRAAGMAAVIVGVAVLLLLFGVELRETSERLVLVAICVITWGVAMLQRRSPARVVAVLGAVVVVLRLLTPTNAELRRERSFFGVLQTQLTPDGKFRFLIHGVTLHGAMRILNSDGTPVTGRPEPLTYYWSGSPLVETIDVARSLRGGQLDRFAVVGLGTGSLACQQRPGEALTFYEIDPLVVQIASDPSRFRFLSECAPGAPIVLGDARLTIANQKDGGYQSIIIDAFSSDAIPVHLLTREAVQTYFRKLDETGFAVFHVSNRHMELARVLAAVARDEGLVAYLREQNVSAEQRVDFISSSKVMVLARRDADLGTIATGGVWKRVDPLPGQRAWTDDYSNLLEPIWRKFVMGDKPAN